MNMKKILLTLALVVAMSATISAQNTKPVCCKGKATTECNAVEAKPACNATEKAVEAKPACCEKSDTTKKCCKKGDKPCCKKGNKPCCKKDAKAQSDTTKCCKKGDKPACCKK